MGHSRRNFLKGSLATVSAAIGSRALVPSFTYAQGAPSQVKNVIEIFLGGGPDSRYLYPYLEGPVDAVLRSRRPNLSVSVPSILVPNSFSQNGRQNPVGFHPSFAPLIDTVNSTGAGVALITEFGATQNASRSHEVAQQMYRDASLQAPSQVSAGWIGRVAASYQLPGLAVWGFNVGDTKLLTVDSSEKPFVVSRLSDVVFRDRNFGAFDCQGLQAGGLSHPCSTQTTGGANLRASSASEDSVYMRDVLRRLQDLSETNSDLGSILASTQESMFQAVPHASRMISEGGVNIENFRVGGANNSLADSCADIARAIRYLELSSSAPASARNATHIFTANRGGWDSHDNQGGSIPGNIQALATAINGLVYYLNEWELLDSTIIFAYGEFGRTTAQNGSAGTDHAEAGHFLVVGGGNRINSGVFGPEASATEAANQNFFTAKVPQTGILRSILAKAFNDPSGLDSVFSHAMPGSVPQGWLL